jgi:hypothetical protein
MKTGERQFILSFGRVVHQREKHLSTTALSVPNRNGIVQEQGVRLKVGKENHRAGSTFLLMAKVKGSKSARFSS